MTTSQHEPFLSMWVVYDHPLDFPEHYVARRWEQVRGGSYGPTESTIQGKLLATVREQLMAMHLTRIHRHAGDDPKILEVWL